MNRIDDAAAIDIDDLPRREHLIGDDDLVIALDRSRLAEAYHLQGRTADAVALQERA